MSPYKAQKVKIILINLAVIAVCLLLNYMQLLGILPVFVMMGCTFAIVANGLYYFANYDDEVKSVNDTFDETGVVFGKSIVEGFSDKDKS